VTTQSRQRFREASYWATGKAAIMAAVYPDGLPTTAVDTVADDWTGVDPLPAGCKSITNYTVTEPGGRADGSSANAQLLHPEATPLDECVVFSAGHADWTVAYAGAMESHVVEVLLDAGFPVLIFDMPNYGLQPEQKVLINGAIRIRSGKNSYHLPADTPAPWDGPSMVRLYTDHVIRAMNTVTRDLGITRFAFVGHSGGGATGSLLCPLEPRFRVVHLMSGGAFTWGPTYSYVIDYETWSGNDVCLAVGGGATYKELCLFSAAFDGRVTVVHVCAEDPYFGPGTAGHKEYLDATRGWIEGNFPGAKISYYEKTDHTSGVDPYHSITTSQAAYVVQHLLANMP
jgi:pimeloyl-ACP methyl ester carboxylesterase